jgi:hypothetical protein
MDIVSRRRLSATVAYGLLVACLVFVVSSPARTTAAGASCAELREWATSYATTNTSPTLDDLAPFSRAQRNAIFNAVSPLVRAELWREHLRRFATRSDLNDQQRAFILNARADLSAATYTDRDPALRREQARKFWASAEPLFPSTEHRRIWFVLGEVTTPSTSRGLPATAGGKSTLPLNLSQYPDCNCNGDDGWLVCASGHCGGGGICHLVFACGPEGLDECDGRCTPHSATTSLARQL